MTQSQSKLIRANTYVEYALKENKIIDRLCLSLSIVIRKIQETMFEKFMDSQNRKQKQFHLMEIDLFMQTYLRLLALNPVS